MGPQFPYALYIKFVNGDLIPEPRYPEPQIDSLAAILTRHPKRTRFGMFVLPRKQAQWAVTPVRNRASANFG